MLDRREVETYGPAGFHLAQKEKDYVQHWILTYLSRSGFHGAFKGGTCLQKAFNLPRYSEDLDFTLIGEEPEFEAISGFLSSSGFTGMSWKLQRKALSLNAKLRYRGPLYNGTELSEGAVLLEFSKRERTLLPPVPTAIIPPYPDLAPYQILIMDKREIAAEKIRALISRVSARDLFDLWFLLSLKTLLDRKLVEGKLEFYGLRFEMKSFEKNVRKLKRLWGAEIGALTAVKIDYNQVAKYVISETKKQL